MTDVSAEALPEVLQGTRLVTLAQNVPGPAAAARLQDFGASVVKVEPPNADPLASANPAWYGALTAGQEVIRLDLKDASERAARRVPRGGRRVAHLQPARLSGAARTRPGGAARRVPVPLLCGHNQLSRPARGRARPRPHVPRGAGSALPPRLAALEQHFWERLLLELGVEDATREDLEEAFVQRTAKEWEQWAKERDLPLAALRDVPQGKEET